MAFVTPPNENPEMLKRAAQEVLSGSVFQRSKANTEMLIFLVEETLAGRADEVSEYSIAIDLMGRGGDFDPASDPIVRVRMRRLREALDRHYALSGDEGVAKIVLPKGRYRVGVDGPDTDLEKQPHDGGGFTKPAREKRSVPRLADACGGFFGFGFRGSDLGIWWAQDGNDCAA